MAATFSSTGSDTFPAGHVIRTSKTNDQDTSSHVSTSSTSPAATGILISTPAVTGSNYNRITFSSSGYTPANILGNMYLYCSKNGGSYARCMGADNQSGGHHVYYAHHRQMNGSWIDTRSITSGTNIYQMYQETASGSFYIVHSGNDYHLTVEEIKV